MGRSTIENMQNICIAAAQSASLPGDILANVEHHLELARAAACESVSFLLFPELSLTGYELQRMQDCIVLPSDPCLQALKDLACHAGMTIVLGAPVEPKVGDKPAIGAICCHPDGTTSIYRKRFLHVGEEAFASPGTDNVHLVRVNDEPLSLAICADTVNPQHPRWAREAGAKIYAAGVLWSRGGYAADATLMQQYAASHGFAALVANHAGPTGGYASGGGSAFWAPGGQLLGVAPDQEPALLIARRQGGEWACVVRSPISTKLR